ncbi:MAG TPA: hypothetical protein VIG64_00715 [Actinomycetota bacterium]
MTDDRSRDLESDKHELATALRRRTEAELRAVHHGTVGDTIAHGRVLRRRRRIALTGAVAVALVLSAVAGPRIGAALMPGTGTTTNPAGMTDEDARAGAATAAIRAVVQAGLMDPLGDLYSYRATERVDDAWRVSFTPGECYRTEEMETCSSGEDKDGNELPNALLDVAVADGDWIVADARGPMDDDEREALLAYRSQAVPIDPHPEFAPIALTEPLEPRAGGGGLEVRALSYWAGPLPDRRITFACHLEAFDGDGRIVYETQGHAYESPATEDERSGHGLATELPPHVDATRAEMACERFTGPGWELLDQPTIEPRAEGRSVHVEGELVWRDRAVVGVSFECELRLLDAAGTEVGDKAMRLDGPWAPNDDPPLRRPLAFVIDVTPPGTEVESVELTCTVPEPPVRETDANDEGGEIDEPEPEDDGPPPSPGAAPQERFEPPDGPRYPVASGRFEGDQWGDYAGRAWELQIWADERHRCHRFAIEPELDDPGGTTCTALPIVDVEEDIGGNGYFPPDMFGGELGIAYGEVTERVARVRVELSNGGATEVDTVAPPDELGIDMRYFVAFVEPSESWELVALDTEGRVIERD